jgi:hypothetical protein
MDRVRKKTQVQKHYTQKEWEKGEREKRQQCPVSISGPYPAGTGNEPSTKISTVS